MKKFSELHLKSQVRLLLFLTVAAIMVFGGLYYASIADALKSKEVRMIDSTHSQISTGVDRINSISRAYCDYLAQNIYVRELVKAEDDSTRYEYNRTLYNILPVITSYNTSIDSVAFMANNGHFIYFNKQRMGVLDRLKEDYGILSPDSTHNLLTIAYKGLDGKDYYCYIKTVFDSGIGTKPEKKIGTCIIIMNAGGIADTLPKYSEEQSTYYAVADNAGHIVASNNKELDETAVYRLREGTDHGAESGLTLISAVGDSNWKLISMTPGENIYSGIRRPLVLGVIFLVFIAAGFMVLLLQIQRTVIKPIEKIAEFTKEGEAYEIKEILRYTNRLSKEIKYVAHSLLNAQSRLYEIEISKHKAEYSALQSQINPHFLYNTLDCIRGHAILSGNDEIVVITSSLSAIMRYCIKGSDFVPVREEAACIKRYIDIIRVRFKGRFEISVDISGEIMDLKMPRFLLQPIVENAVYHGLEPNYGGGEAKITGRLQGDCIIFEVYDNGCGIPPETLERINCQLHGGLEKTDGNEKGIGLININRRVKMLFGGNYGLSAQSVAGSFTRIQVKLPSKINTLDVFFQENGTQ